ncbi:hypothetical protein [Mesorhizobium sp.]|uniref:hypothetical protein n=1 Tax=Mesorhizobium sp. TaxID=1871066 RepID=UPI000FE66A24|nr:hypothetical protein [Mesorhizobium sp.]RWA62120.1 MAG: hypothetical protein EOQ27_15655 [Mesorhizobium sp.]
MTPEREIELIMTAAGWLRSTPKAQRPKPSIVELHERYGLRASQAILAIRYATEFDHQQGVASNDDPKS